MTDYNIPGTIFFITMILFLAICGAFAYWRRKQAGQTKKSSLKHPQDEFRLVLGNGVGDLPLRSVEKIDVICEKGELFLIGNVRLEFSGGMTIERVTKP